MKLIYSKPLIERIDISRRDIVARNEVIYKTKLVSLFLLRLLHNDSVEEFYLNSEMINVGYFSDICFKVKVTGVDRPTMVFIKTENIIDIENIIIHIFTSSLEITERFAFAQLCNDSIFGGKFEDTECLFVLYTNSPVKAINKRIPYHSGFSELLNNLICTGDENGRGVQLEYTQDEVEVINAILLKYDIIGLAEELTGLFRFTLSGLAGDSYVGRYHVILAQRVVHLSDIRHEEMQVGEYSYRELTFRPDFFFSKDRNIKTLKYILCKGAFGELVKKHLENDFSSVDACSTTSAIDIIEKQISEFLSEPSALTLSHLIGIYITYDNHHLRFIIERPSTDLQKLNDINRTRKSKSIHKMVNNAEIIAGKNLLMSVKFNVPTTFGNIDVALGGDSNKNDERLNVLSNFIESLCQLSKSDGLYNIVTIDGSEDDDRLKLKGGIASAVGNLITYDKATKLLKFTDNPEALQENARALYDKLKRSSVGDKLTSYRFDVKASHFPKLEFDRTDEIKTLLNKFIIYEKQSNHHEVENIIKEEIERQQSTDEQNVSVPSDKMFQYCHSAIQNWWMTKIIANSRLKPHIWARQHIPSPWLWYTKHDKHFKL